VTVFSSQYGPLIEDLVTILLRSDPELRPTAADILSIPLIRPLADEYVQRANSAIRRRTLDSPISNYDVIVNEGCSTPESLRRASECPQQRVVVTDQDRNESVGKFKIKNYLSTVMAFCLAHES